MKRVSKHVLISFVALAMSATQHTPLWAQQVNTGGDFPFHRSIVFGDSLSDSGSFKDLRAELLGQVVSLFEPRLKSMTDGKSTNGAVWNQYLVPNQDRGASISSGSFLRILNIFNPNGALYDTAGNYGSTTSNGGKSINYAVSGAKYLDPGGAEARLIPTLDRQIAAFLNAAGYASNAIDKNDLVTFWGGANDAFGVIGDSAATQSTAAAAKANAIEGLNTLYAAGARKFLIPNLPNFGSTPSHSSNALEANKTSDAFNQRTAEFIREFKAAHPDVTIYAPDMVPILDTAKKYGSTFGFTNVTEGCFLVSACYNAETGSDAQNQYLFWDGVHPTTRTHSYIANYFKEYWLNPDLAGFYVASPNNLFSTVRHFFFPTDDRTLAGYLTGDAALYKLNDGRLTVTGENSYTGGTFIKDGTLRLGNGGTTGSIIGNVAMDDRTLLQFDRSNTYVFDGAISGNGAVEQNGTGRTVLNGANTYTGATTINDGLLSVNGSLVSKVTINDGGALGGIGNVGGLTAKNGSLVSPGNSIGKLTVNGNATFEQGSGYAVEVAGDGRSDKLSVSGTATLLGGTVLVRPENSTALLTNEQVKALNGKTYVILTANGGVSGTFENVTPYYRFYGAHLSYNPDDVVLTLAKNGASFASVGTTANQKMALASIQSMVALPQAAASEPAVDKASDTDLTKKDAAQMAADKPEEENVLYNAVAGSTVNDNLSAALPELTGDLHPTVSGVLVEDSRFVRDAATNRVRAAFGGVSAKATPVLAVGPADKAVLANADTATTAMWAEGYGSWSHIDSDGNAVDRNRSIGGFITGLDGILADTWRLGVLAGYANSSLDGAGSSASVDSYQIGLYGGTKWNDLGLRFGTSFAHHEIETDRSVDFAGITDKNSASYDANSFQIFGEAGYEFNTGFAMFEPFAGLAYSHLKTDGFSEEGGVTALTGLDDTTDATTTTLGLRASRQFAISDTTTLTANGMIGWQHAFGDTTPEASLAFAGGNAFTTQGLPIAEDALALEAGFDVNLAESTALGLSYHGQIADNVSDHSIKAEISVRF